MSWRGITLAMAIALGACALDWPEPESEGMATELTAAEQLASLKGSRSPMQFVQLTKG